MSKRRSPSRISRLHSLLWFMDPRSGLKGGLMAGAVIVSVIVTAIGGLNLIIAWFSGG